jgi:hypothetical protein
VREGGRRRRAATAARAWRRRPCPRREEEGERAKRGREEGKKSRSRSGSRGIYFVVRILKRSQRSRGEKQKKLTRSRRNC